MRKNYTNIARFISIASAITLATMALNDQPANPLVWCMGVLLIIATAYWVAKDKVTA